MLLGLFSKEVMRSISKLVILTAAEDKYFAEPTKCTHLKFFLFHIIAWIDAIIQLYIVKEIGFIGSMNIFNTPANDKTIGVVMNFAALAIVTEIDNYAADLFFLVF